MARSTTACPTPRGCSTTTRLKRRKYQRACFTFPTKTTGSSSRRTRACGTASSSPGSGASMLVRAVAPYFHEVAAARHLAPAAAAVLRFVQEQPVAGRTSAAAQPRELARGKQPDRGFDDGPQGSIERGGGRIERPREALGRRRKPGKRRCAGVLGVNGPEVLASGGVAFSARQEHARQRLAKLDSSPQELLRRMRRARTSSMQLGRLRFAQRSGGLEPIHEVGKSGYPLLLPRALDAMAGIAEVEAQGAPRAAKGFGVALALRPRISNLHRIPFTHAYPQDLPFEGRVRNQ